MSNTFLWHDYETWGATPSADKPSQFAAIRTNEELEEVGEPIMFYCQPTNDCIPAPEACLITGITPQQALKQGVPEPEFFKRIHSEFSVPGTCGVGYNSIRFDDEVTRYGLYRNFYDPYEREWRNGNSRWDIIDMVRLTYALRPDHIQWPLNDDGSPSFKLENLSAANGLLHEQAHDALSDVRATIGIARLIRKYHPDLYNYAYSLRDKKRVAALIDVAQKKPLLHVSSRFPAAQGCAALVVPLMQHPKNANSVIVYDLSVDPTPLLTLSADEVIARLFTRQADLPEGVERIPLKEVHLNKSPMVATTKLIDEAVANRLGIDKSLCEKHWQALRSADLNAKLNEIYTKNNFENKTDPEQQLYDSFIGNRDKPILEAIRQAEPQDLAAFSTQLGDTRLKQLLFRYRARFYPQSLNEQEMETWEEWRYLRLTDATAGASLTLDDYFQRLDELSELHPDKQTIFRDLYAWGDALLH